MSVQGDINGLGTVIYECEILEQAEQLWIAY